LHERFLRIEAETLEHDKVVNYNTFVKLKEKHFDGIDNQLTLILDLLHKKLYCIEYFGKLAEIEKESAGYF